MNPFQTSLNLQLSLMQCDCFTFEHTICLSNRWNWFQKKELIPVRDLDELEIVLDEKQPFNKISIFEYPDIKQLKDQFSTYRTNRIQSYCIDILLDNAWKTIYMSEETMGDCKVIHFPTPYKTSKLKLRVLKATAPPSIIELNVIKVCPPI